MEKFRNLPLYKIVVNAEEDETGMTCISLVDEPAVERDFMVFKDEKEPLKFAIQNDEQHIVFGVAVIANKPIYRYSYDMGGYFVVFDQEAIDNMIQKYSRQGLWNNVSLQHNGENISGAVMVEFFKKDTEKGVNPKGFEDIDDGSLFVSYKITDENLWNEIKTSGELNGFSIEINADLEPTNKFVDDGVEISEDEQELFDWLKELFGDDVEFLYSDEKKKCFKADWSLIDKAIENDEEVEFRLPNKTVKGYPYTTYTREGSKNVAVWDGKEWHVMNNTNITSTKLTGNKGGVDWGKAIANKGFDYVQKSIDDAADVKSVNPQPKNDYERALMEHRIAMITYVDEVGRETGICVGNRQCGVFELGYTRAGNACMRVYEYAGPTHHTENPIPSWRNLLYSRIRSFRIVDWLEPLTNAPAGFREIGQGEDRDGYICTLRSDLKKL